MGKDPKKPTLNVYLASSPGGHLTETLSLVEAFEGCDVSVITLDFPNMKGITLEGIRKIHRIKLLFDYSIKFGLPLTLLKSFFEIFWIFLKKKPHIIFSTGSEIALPAFLLGKFVFRSKVVYIECFTRTQTLSGTGKVVYAFSDLFLVQWPELAAKYEKASYQGRLI
jgi:UDP-N-acetylglucosamine:LPS N-acetylglucosamine transferase